MMILGIGFAKRWRLSLLISLWLVLMVFFSISAAETLSQPDYSDIPGLFDIANLEIRSYQCKETSLKWDSLLINITEGKWITLSIENSDVPLLILIGDLAVKFFAHSGYESKSTELHLGSRTPEFKPAWIAILCNPRDYGRLSMGVKLKKTRVDKDVIDVNNITDKVLGIYPETIRFPGSDKRLVRIPQKNNEFKVFFPKEKSNGEILLYSYGNESYGIPQEIMLCKPNLDQRKVWPDLGIISMFDKEKDYRSMTSWERARQQVNLLNIKQISSEIHIKQSNKAKISHVLMLEHSSDTDNKGYTEMNFYGEPLVLDDKDNQLTYGDTAFYRIIFFDGDNPAPDYLQFIYDDFKLEAFSDGYCQIPRHIFPKTSVYGRYAQEIVIKAPKSLTMIPIANIIEASQQNDEMIYRIRTPRASQPSSIYLYPTTKKQYILSNAPRLPFYALKPTEFVDMSAEHQDKLKQFEVAIVDWFLGAPYGYHDSFHLLDGNISFSLEALQKGFKAELHGIEELLLAQEEYFGLFPYDSLFLGYTIDNYSFNEPGGSLCMSNPILHLLSEKESVSSGFQIAFERFAGQWWGKWFPWHNVEDAMFAEMIRSYYGLQYSRKFSQDAYADRLKNSLDYISELKDPLPLNSHPLRVKDRDHWIEYVRCKGILILRTLQTMLGDELFFKCIKGFNILGRQAAKEGNTMNLWDFEQFAERVIGDNTLREMTGSDDMHWFFEQWWERSELPIFDVNTTIAGDRIRLHITQLQEKPFTLPLVLTVTLEDDSIKTTKVLVQHKVQSMELRFAGMVKEAAINREVDSLCIIQARRKP